MEFVAIGDGTNVVLEHSELASEESGARHAEGWRGTLDNLGRRIFGEGNES